MESSKIEITEEDFLYIMHGINAMKKEHEDTLLRREGILKELHKYKDGFESTVREWIVEEEREIRKVDDFKIEFISRYVKGQGKEF